MKGIAACGSSLTATPDAYIHRSEGKPGIDAGTGWRQCIHVHLHSAQFRGEIPNSEAGMGDGELRLDSAAFRNEIPLPCVFEGKVELDVSFFEHASVHIGAKAIRVERIGEATYVEEFH